MISRFTLIMAIALLLFPVMAAAQAPAAAPQAAPAPQQPQPQVQPQPPCQPGPGGTCPMLTPEQMKQMQAKKGPCCMLQGQGDPQCQQLQKQMDDLRQRVEALEKQQGQKK